MRHFSKNQHSRYGFTIVELLIVIVVIAILASISIVAYNGIQDRAHTTTVEADIANLTKTMELWKIKNGGVYPTISQLNTVDIQASKGSYLTTTRNNFYYCASADLSQYAFGIVAKNDQGYMLNTGSVGKRSGGSTYQSQTCQQVGHSNGDPGTSGYSGGSGNWANWVNG